MGSAGAITIPPPAATSGRESRGPSRPPQRGRESRRPSRPPQPTSMSPSSLCPLFFLLKVTIHTAITVKMKINYAWLLLLRRAKSHQKRCHTASDLYGDAREAKTITILIGSSKWAMNICNDSRVAMQSRAIRLPLGSA